MITEAGNHPKVVALVYVAAFAPDAGESVLSLGKPYPPPPLGDEIRTVTPKGIAEDFARDLTDREKAILTGSQ